MKTKLFLLLLLSISSAQAKELNGFILFNGKGVTFDNPDLALATTVENWDNAFVIRAQGEDGHFNNVHVGDTPMMATPWVFDPFTPTLALCRIGGFTFDLISSAGISRGSFHDQFGDLVTFLTVEGTGTVSETGFTTTPGSWFFEKEITTGKRFNGQHTEFGFSASATTPGGVPDSGSTVMLLGISCVGLSLGQRFMPKFGVRT